MMSRGGKREGSGRKPVGEAPGVMASYRLPPEVKAMIKAKAEALGLTQPRLIALAVEAYQPGEVDA